MSTELLIKAPASCGVVTATKGGLAEEKSDSIHATALRSLRAVVIGTPSH